MTPEEARALLEGAAPGEWQWDDTGNVAAVDGDGWEHVADYVYEEDGALIVAAPGMAAMIAGMREEWGVSYRWGNDDTDRIEWGKDTRDEAVKWARKLENHTGSRAYVSGIVRRYVTTPEEA